MKSGFCHNKVFRPVCVCLRNPRTSLFLCFMSLEKVEQVVASTIFFPGVVVKDRRKQTKKSTYWQTRGVEQDSMPFWNQRRPLICFRLSLSLSLSLFSPLPPSSLLSPSPSLSFSFSFFLSFSLSLYFSLSSYFFESISSFCNRRLENLIAGSWMLGLVRTWCGRNCFGLTSDAKLFPVSCFTQTHLPSSHCHGCQGDDVSDSAVVHFFGHQCRPKAPSFIQLYTQNNKKRAINGGQT